jgi:hypothetical protein
VGFAAGQDITRKASIPTTAAQTTTTAKAMRPFLIIAAPLPK